MNCKDVCIEENEPCINSACRQWIDYKSDLNCVLVCAERNGPLTLQETSKRIGVSYVRIKQIQDKAIKKMIKKTGTNNY